LVNTSALIVPEIGSPPGGEPMAIILVIIVLAAATIFVLRSAVNVVPQEEAWIVERLGKYDQTLKAGLHLIAPFFNTIKHRHNLKEQFIAVDQQDCLTKDKVLIKVDAVVHYRIKDPVRVSYAMPDASLGAANDRPGRAHDGASLAVAQLARTTIRTEIDKIDLDRTFEERSAITAHIVGELNEVAAAWGVQVLRYEIKNLRLSEEVRSAIEGPVRAEHEKRAAILESEGKRDALINLAEARKQEEIRASEARQQREINEAEARAAAIRAVAAATAAGIREVANALQETGGLDAARLSIAQRFGKLDKGGDNALALPDNVSGVAASMIALVMGGQRDSHEAGLWPASPVTEQAPAPGPKIQLLSPRFVAAIVGIMVLLSAASVLMLDRRLRSFHARVEEGGGPPQVAEATNKPPQPVAPVGVAPASVAPAGVVPAGSVAVANANQAKATVAPGAALVQQASLSKGGEHAADLVAAAGSQSFQEVFEIAREGNPGAEAALGNMYLRGEGIAVNYAQAMHWFQQGASHGDPKAQSGLGYMYAAGEGVPKNYGVALRWFIAAAAQADPDAEYNLAMMYDQGQGAARDQAQALKWLRRAAAQEDDRAQYQLGSRYLMGQGVSRDYSLALQWLRKPAERGNLPAQNALGFVYERAGGRIQNYGLAMRWYRKAAEQGYAKAQLNLGLMHENGEGMVSDYAGAARWYRMAAEQGEMYAQTRLGVLYCNGRGVNRDYATAIEWFTKAASQGEPKAEYNLGVMYDTGVGVPRNYAVAAQWYQKAAAQGHVDAQYNLGYLYEHGQGVARDNDEALEWYRRAAGQGDSSALQRVRVLESANN
jgi:TPR repeat protein/regulator of protease activity HflC (stomatin/prohibitin superfamily)